MKYVDSSGTIYEIISDEYGHRRKETSVDGEIDYGSRWLDYSSAVESLCDLAGRLGWKPIKE